MTYRVGTIWSSHFAIEICSFYCGDGHCFYRYTDIFLLCGFDLKRECDILWMYLVFPLLCQKVT